MNNPTLATSQPFLLFHAIQVLNSSFINTLFFTNFPNHSPPFISSPAHLHLFCFILLFSLRLTSSGSSLRWQPNQRNYLWGSSAEYHMVPLIAWDKVTLPKYEGGLGIKEAELWNTATVAKLVNWIYGKADRLWIRWVNQIYIKNRVWHTYYPPNDVSWAWKCICRVKEIMKPAYIDDQWSEDPKGYSIRSGYEWLRPKQALQSWKNFVWNKWNYPKHAMISWITMNNGLKVKYKLYQFGCCLIIDVAVETQSHLFFECSYSRQVIAAVETCCGFKVDVSMSAPPNGIVPKPALKQDVHSLI
ncbi:uncharacterized protein LOC141601121 [Silene latifolia]|uniref:uncharacterized protein LOC141601121 n=1 Tax=Silene latifolia TaxID=37657 RepID=UPI003D77CFAB